MAIEPIEDRAAWDRFVEESPNGLLFHRWDFLRIVEKYTGYKLFPWGIYSGDELIALLPLFSRRRKGLRFVYSPPQTTLCNVPYLGFAYCRDYDHLLPREREAYAAFLLAEAEKVIRPLAPNYVSLALEPGDVDVRPYLWSDYEPVLQYTYIIDLDRPLEAIWKGLESNCRTAIRNEEKRSPTIEPMHDAEALFGMMRQRLTIENTFYRRQSPEYLKELLRAFPDNIKMYSVYCDGEFVDAAVYYGYRDLYIGWMGAAGAHGSVDVNEYMIWDGIRKAKAAGFKRFENLGASERRLNPFKTKFNPSLVPYFYMIKRDALYRTTTGTSEAIDRIRKSLRPPASPMGRRVPVAGEVEQ